MPSDNADINKRMHAALNDVRLRGLTVNAGGMDEGDRQANAWLRNQVERGQRRIEQDLRDRGEAE